jgi:three-Cys-motif partner protein
MAKKPDFAEVGPWAQEKLSKLSKYLQAYATILGKQKEKGKFEGFVYVDAFAGAGRARVRDASESSDEKPRLFDFGDLGLEDVEARGLLDGSPRVALGIEPEFTACVFLEKSRKRIAELERLKAEFSRRRIRIEQGDCNAYLCEELVKRADWTRWRAVVFLDPFGMQVPWSTLEALGATGGIEIILNLPIGMAIQRLLKRTGRFTDEEKSRLDLYFGDAAWYPLLYEEGTDLFGERRIAKQETAERRLLAWYRDRLKKVFGEVSDAFLVKNTKGAHLYHLIWAGRNATGLKIANYVLSTGTKSRVR